ncbi:MAG: DUF4317 domain-containing protein [Clostridia bacterium]|nr:DUF4317 domain-containing protein [Clostridia bacterium]
MNARDYAELKRRLNPEHRSPTVIRGFYFTPDGDLVSSFAEDVRTLPEDTLEKYMSLFKKTLSGTYGQQLLPISYGAAASETDEAHERLMALCRSGLKDESSLDSLCQSMVEAIHRKREADAQSVDAARKADSYLALLLHDSYDVPYRTHGDELDPERGSEVFSWILCCFCPVRQQKPVLSYSGQTGVFRVQDALYAVAAPELGFMFPAFEERAADIYTAMFYTRDTADTHDAFVRSVLGSEIRMPADEQKQTFSDMLATTLEEECSMDVVQAVHDKVSGLIRQQKEDKHAEPLQMTGRDMREVLEECGVSPARSEAFEREYGEIFGSHAELPAVNMVSTGAFKVSTPSVSIKVDPDHSELVQTRIIDGQRYILILADGDVEVNGVNVQIR